MGRIQQLCMVFCLLCFSFHGNAQNAADYTFTTTTESFYTSISGAGGAVTASLSCDDCSQIHMPIGFAFNFCGIGYTSVSAASNGLLCLVDSNLAPYNNVATNITNKGFLLPFWDDLSGTPVLGSSTPSTAYYITTGVAPNRVFTFEWAYFNKALSSCTTCAANFQVRLYEGTNTIEFAYGPSGLPAMSATIGIANSYTDWKTISGSTPTASNTVFTDTISVLPASGQVYRWQVGNNAVPELGNTITSKFVVFPNPNNGAFSFKLTSDVNESITAIITDVYGRVVSSSNVFTNTDIVLKELLPAGVYFLSTSGTSTTYTKMFIVEQ